MMKFILMSKEHIEQAAALEQLCFSAPWSAASLASELENPLSLWVVAVDGERLAGYVGSQSVMGEADMMNLAVQPEYRRQGIARQLVSVLIEHLSANDVKSLSLEVRESNIPALRLYEQMGFGVVGRRPNYYWMPKEAALILRKEWEA